MSYLKSRRTVILGAATLGVVLVLAWLLWRGDETEAAKITGYEVSSDGRTVTLYVALGGGAKILSAGVVATDADSVSFEVQKPVLRGDRTADLVIGAVDVELDEPLAGRTVLDASDGAEVRRGQDSAG